MSLDKIKMKNIGSTIIKKGKKYINITDVPEVYVSWLGREVLLSIKYLSEDNINFLFDNFDSTKEWSIISQRERDDALFYFSKVNSIDAIKWFHEVINNDLRASVAGFLPMLYCGKNTSSMGKSVVGEFIVDLDTKKLLINQDIKFELSFKDIKLATKEQIEFFSENIEAVLADSTIEIESLGVINKYTVEDYVRIIHERNMNVSEDLEEKRLKEFEERMLLNEKREKNSFEYLIKKANKIKNSTLKEETFQKIQTLLNQKILKLLHFDNEKVLNFNKILSENKKNNLEAYKKTPVTRDVFDDDEENELSFTIYSATLTTDDLRIFVHLLDNVLLRNSKEKNKILENVIWDVGFDNDTKKDYGVIQFFIENKNQNQEVVNFISLMRKLRFNFNIYSSSMSGLDFQENKSEDKEFIPSYLTFEKFKNFKENNSLLDNFDFNLPFFIEYESLRNFVLTCNSLDKYKSVNMLKFSILNRDVEIFKKLIVSFKEGFNSIKKEDWRVSAANSILNVFAESKRLELKNNKSYQISMKNFYNEIKSDISFLNKYMLESEKEVFFLINNNMKV